MTREGLRDGPTADCKSAARAQTQFDSEPSHQCRHPWWQAVAGIALWGLAIGLALALVVAPVACVARLVMECR